MGPVQGPPKLLKTRDPDHGQLAKAKKPEIAKISGLTETPSTTKPLKNNFLLACGWSITLRLIDSKSFSRRFPRKRSTENSSATGFTGPDCRSLATAPEQPRNLPRQINSHQLHPMTPAILDEPIRGAVQQRRKSRSYALQRPDLVPHHRNACEWQKTFFAPTV
jgi:hypothetical protein